MEPILFPDVEAWAVDYMTAALAARTEPYAADVHVADGGIPRAKPPRMVLFRRDGGSRLDLRRESARLTVRVFGTTDTESRELASLVRALIGAAADGNPVALVREMAGPTPVPDAAGKPAYRLMSYDLTVVGQPL